MTDQDPTQPFEAPAAPVPAAPPVPPAPDTTQVAAPLPPAPPAPPAPAAGYAAPVAPAPQAAIDPVALDGPLPAVAVPVEPVTSASPKGPGRSKIKWAVAALVTLLVAGTVAAGTLVLTSDSGDASVLAWTPADSVAYAELRLDLPGSQDKELPELMKAFPGFEDQAAFPVKFSEVMDRLTGSASDGTVSWKTDIEPWFGGQVGASVGPLPTSVDSLDVRALMLLSVTDEAKASAWIDGMVETKGATTTTESYQDVQITLVTPPADQADMVDIQHAYAVVGPVLAMGDVDSVKASIATGGKTGLPTDSQFKEAEASVSGDRLAFAYLDAAAVADAVEDLAGPIGEMLPELPATITDLQVPWAVMALRAEDGSLIVDTRSPHVAAMGAPKNAKSTLPGLLPPTTVFLAEGHDVGEALARAKDQLASEPSLKDGVKQVEDALGLLGGFEAVAGWMGEAGIAITLDGDEIAGGLLVTPTDAEAADRLFTQINGVVAFAGSQVGVEVTEEDYKGTTIRVVSLGGLAAMGGEAFGVDLPADATVAYAVTDDVVVIGYGTEFVKAVLDTVPNYTQQVMISGSPDGGYFTLEFDGRKTDSIRYDASAKDVEATLEALSNVEPGEVVAAGGVLPAAPVSVTFKGRYADGKAKLLVADGSALSGAGTPAITVVTAAPTESLADQERFAEALAQAGTEHASLVWLDIAAVRATIETMVPDDMKTEYDTELKPYLVGFDALIGTTTPGEEIDAGTLILRTAGS